MRKKIFGSIGGLILSVVVPVLLVPGCVINLVQGTGEETEPDPGGGDGGAGGQASTGGGTLTPEEQAALEALQNADPQALAIGTATATYAAVTSASLVESQIVDPTTVDPATVEQLLEQSAPLGWDQALSWIASTDPSLIPTGIVAPKYACMDEPYLCPHRTFCPIGEGAICHVTECGTGACPYCPFFSNLVYKAWCVYGCVRPDGAFVGGAYILRTIFNNYNGPYCRAWTTPL